MKDIKGLKRSLKDLIVDRVTLCIDELRRVVNEDSRKYDDLIMLQSQYKELKTKENNGTFDPSIDRVHKEQVKNRIITFITDLEEEDFDKAAFKLHGIEESILVVSHDKKSSADMNKFFSSYTFINTDYDFSGKVIYPSHCDLIVFDNRIMGKVVPNPKFEEELNDTVKSHLALLKDYLTKTNYNIVYYGEFLYWLNDHRDRVNAANSKFTLYPRIKETIDCMKYYKEE